MSTTPESVRILLVDDHTLLREALRDILLAEQDFLIVGEAGDGDAAVQLAAQARPDIVLLDVEMPGSQPTKTVRRLLETGPNCRVVILSMYDDPWLVQELLEIGISGYLHKSVSRRDLVAAIRAVGLDAQRVTVSVTRGSLTSTGGNPSMGLLSVREQEVLTLVAKAMSNRQIAGQLSITEGTVKRHLRNIFGKLNAVSRIDAVNKATSASLIRDVR